MLFKGLNIGEKWEPDFSEAEISKLLSLIEYNW